jgi:hypothetical protein
MWKGYSDRNMNLKMQKEKGDGREENAEEIKKNFEKQKVGRNLKEDSDELVTDDDSDVSMKD